jgi:hypothetical protein
LDKNTIILKEVEKFLNDALENKSANHAGTVLWALKELGYEVKKKESDA